MCSYVFVQKQQQKIFVQTNTEQKVECVYDML